MLEKTLILLKPDAIKRRLMGDILSRFEQKGLKIEAMRFMKLEREQAEEHYFMHKDKDFFINLIQFITSGPLLAMVIESDNAIALCRKVVGATNPMEAEAGSIRGDFAFNTTENLVHASDCREAAEREIKIFFRKSEVFNY
ncbi:MAG: nucleoside-diphosphate kinase [Candidatus Wallbacteria bacterium]|nr:nucleoside-diphosphate kinase [Candidatus Wallbacteria bacterium]